MDFPIQTRDEAVERYGAIEGTTWPAEGSWMELVPVDPALGDTWFVDGDPTLPCRHIYCNKDVAPMLKAALATVLAQGLGGELKSFDGCLNIRAIRGSSSLSAHAYGLALDLNCNTNPLGGTSSWSDAFVKCFTDVGFFWGGNFSGRKDPMHFSALDW